MPYFFEDILTAERDLDYLIFELVSALTVMFHKEIDPVSLTETLFFSMNYLQGDGVQLNWPPRFLHLTPLDYFLW